MTERKRRRKRIGLILALAVLLGIGGVFAVKTLQLRRLPEWMRQTQLENHQVGTMRRIVRVRKNQAIAVAYPHLDHTEIDRQIEAAVQAQIQAFERENQGIQQFSALYADYESCDLNGVGASVQISFERRGAVNGKTAQSWTFDLKKDRALGFLDLFSEAGLKHLVFLTEQRMEAGMTEEAAATAEQLLRQNRAQLYLSEEEVRVLFPPSTLQEQDDEVQARIPMEKMIGYLDEQIRHQLGLQAQGRIVDPNRPMVALTYDDGPNRQVTPRILDALKEVEGAATFFVLGSRAVNHQDLLQRMVEEGSEIGNHTFGHIDLTRQNASQILDQLDACWQVMEEMGLTIPQRLLRPTFGAYNDFLRATAPYPLILWSVDTRDWAHQNVDRSVRMVQQTVQDGDIILMHDMYEQTAEASEQIIRWLSDQGFQLVTVSELFEARGILLKPGEIYRCAYPS